MAQPWDVFVRLSPPADDSGEFTVAPLGPTTVALNDGSASREAEFAAVFPTDERAETIFESAVAPHIMNMLRGVSTMIVAVGPSAPCMFDCMVGSPDAPGIIPQACERLIAEVDQTEHRSTSCITSSFVALTSKRVVDLCNPGDASASVDMSDSGLIVGAKERFARTADDILDTLDEGLDGERALIAGHELVDGAYSTVFTVTYCDQERVGVVMFVQTAPPSAGAHTAVSGALRSAVSLRAAGEALPVDLVSDFPLTALMFRAFAGRGYAVSAIACLPISARAEDMRPVVDLASDMTLLKTTPESNEGDAAVSQWRAVRDQALIADPDDTRQSNDAESEIGRMIAGKVPRPGDMPAYEQMEVPGTGPCAIAVYDPHMHARLYLKTEGIETTDDLPPPAFAPQHTNADAEEQRPPNAIVAESLSALIKTSAAELAVGPPVRRNCKPFLSDRESEEDVNELVSEFEAVLAGAAEAHHVVTSLRAELKAETQRRDHEREEHEHAMHEVLAKLRLAEAEVARLRAAPAPSTPQQIADGHNDGDVTPLSATARSVVDDAASPASATERLVVRQLRSRLDQADRRIADLESLVARYRDATTAGSPPTKGDANNAIETAALAELREAATKEVASIKDTLRISLSNARRTAEQCLPASTLQGLVNPMTDPSAQLLALELQALVERLGVHCTTMQPQHDAECRRRVAAAVAEQKQRFTERHEEVLKAFCEKQQGMIRKMYADYSADLQRIKGEYEKKLAEARAAAGAVSSSVGEAKPTTPVRADPRSPISRATARRTQHSFADI